MLVIGATLIYLTRYVALGAGSRLLPIYSVERDDKKIAVTFNCAWGGGDVPLILETLDKYGAKATFFVLGTWADACQNEIKTIYEAGHEIGTHSNTHPDMTKISKDEITEELLRSSEKIEAITGEKPKLFRAPSGAYNNELIKTADELGFTVIQWDIDSRDWKKPSAEEIINNVVENVQNGSILLFHCGMENTDEALPKILEKLKNEGYEFVNVSELICKGEYTIDNFGRQHQLSKK